MTLLDDTTRTYTAAPSPSPLLSGVLAALQAVAGSVVLVLAPVVLAWVTGSGSSTTWSQAVRVTVDVWLAAVGTHLLVGGTGTDAGAVTLLPLGLTLLPLVACWLSGRRTARALDPHGERIAAGFGRARPVGAPRRALVTALLTWTAACAVLAATAGATPVRPVLWTAVVGGAVVGALGFLAGSAAWEAGGARAGVGLLLRRAARTARTPAVLRRTARPAAIGLAVQLAAGAALVAVALVTGWSTVARVQSALEPGLVGGAVLLVLQAAVLPNAAVWAAAFLSGPGFAVGTGTSVTPAAADVGPLPALPLLGVLPLPGALPGAVLAVLAVPFLAGAALGVATGRRTPHGTGLVARVRTAVDACVAALLAGIGFGVLAHLSGGAAGPGRMAVTGPDPLAAGIVLAGELAAGALLALVALQLGPLVRHRLRR